jgi:hypothetical protein
MRLGGFIMRGKKRLRLMDGGGLGSELIEPASRVWNRNGKPGVNSLRENSAQ